MYVHIWRKIQNYLINVGALFTGMVHWCGLVAHLLSCSIISRDWHLRCFRLNGGKPSSKMLPDLVLDLVRLSEAWSYKYFVSSESVMLLLLIHCSLIDPIFAIAPLLLLFVRIYNFCFNSARLLASSGNQLCLIQIRTWLVCFVFLFLMWSMVSCSNYLQKNFCRNMWKNSQELIRSLVSNYIKYLYEQLKVSSESLCLPYVFFWLTLI